MSTSFTISPTQQFGLVSNDPQERLAVVQAAVQQNGWIYLYISDAFQRNPDIARLSCPTAWRNSSLRTT